MKLDKWLSLMEKNGQADIPMDFNGAIMTPREFVTLAKRGEVTLAIAEAPSNVFTMQELLKTRFRDRYNEGKVEGVYRCNPDGVEFYYSPERQMEEINNNTKMGEVFLLEEKGLMDELKKLLLI